MDSQISQLFSISALPEEQVVATILRVFTAFLLSTLAAFVYRQIQRRERITISNLPYTMILFSVIVCGMMMVVGDSLARAFGLLGALSVLRFRINIKNPTDMAAILFTMTIGISCGIGWPAMSAVFTIMVLCIFILLNFYHVRRYRLRRRLIILCGNCSVINAFIDELNKRFRIRASVGTPESFAKSGAVWSVDLRFPGVRVISDWEQWLSQDKRILFSARQYHINLDLTNWSVNNDSQ